MAKKKKKGRPSKYTKMLADKICALVAASPKNSMLAISKREGMPSQSMMYRWLDQHEEFREKYARAKERQADVLVEEMISIADDAAEDWEVRTNRNGEEYIALDKDAVQRSRLMIETRKWLAGKLKPKKYGDKLDLKVDGKLETTPALTIIGAVPDGKGK